MMEDRFGNPIIVMPDGESFYLNKLQIFFKTLSNYSSNFTIHRGYSTIAKKFANNIVKRTLAQIAHAGAVQI